jgi:catechol 2,3-dioxygenase-like lactoylglutathione lyase family enzyme
MKLIPNIPVDDVARSAEYYRQVLGFDLVGVRGKGEQTRAQVRLGDVEFIFRSRGENPLPPPVEDPDHLVIWHIQVDDVYGLYERVKRRALLVRALEPTLFGHAEFMIQDIDGRILAFSQATPLSTTTPPEHGRQARR